METYYFPQLAAHFHFVCTSDFVEEKRMGRRRELVTEASVVIARIVAATKRIEIYIFKKKKTKQKRIEPKRVRTSNSVLAKCNVKRREKSFRLLITIKLQSRNLSPFNKRPENKHKNKLQEIFERTLHCWGKRRKKSGYNNFNLWHTDGTWKLSLNSTSFLQSHTYFLVIAKCKSSNVYDFDFFFFTFSLPPLSLTLRLFLLPSSQFQCSFYFF